MLIKQMYYSIESKAAQISDPQVVSHIILHITVHNGTYASKKLVFFSSQQMEISKFCFKTTFL